MAPANRSTSTPSVPGGWCRRVRSPIADAKIPDEDREARTFYASLYVGLDAAVKGDDAKARAHLRRATASPWPIEAGYGPRYMWHVGRLHFESLSK